MVDRRQIRDAVPILSTQEVTLVGEAARVGVCHVPWVEEFDDRRRRVCDCELLVGADHDDWSTLQRNRYISVITVKDRKVSHWRDYLDPLRVFAALEGR